MQEIFLCNRIDMAHTRYRLSREQIDAIEDDELEFIRMCCLTNDCETKKPVKRLRRRSIKTLLIPIITHNVDGTITMKPDVYCCTTHLSQYYRKFPKFYFILKDIERYGKQDHR